MTVQTFIMIITSCETMPVTTYEFIVITHLALHVCIHTLQESYNWPWKLILFGLFLHLRLSI